MALELTEEQLEVMAVVRENLVARARGAYGKGSEFICNQVSNIIAAKEGKEDYARWSELSDESKEKIKILRDAIRDAMDGADTVNEYLSVNVPNLSDIAIFSGFSTLARLAWLDRMLETKVVA